MEYDVVTFKSLEYLGLYLAKHLSLWTHTGHLHEALKHQQSTSKAHAEVLQDVMVLNATWRATVRLGAADPSPMDCVCVCVCSLSGALLFMLVCCFSLVNVLMHLGMAGCCKGSVEDCAVCSKWTLARRARGGPGARRQPAH